MLTLVVHYREDDELVSENMLTGFVPFGDYRCSALQVGSDFMKPMYYERITNALDSETGEVVSVRELCGAPPAPGPITSEPIRQPRPKGKKRGHGSEAFRGQRRKDSDNYIMLYRNNIIYNHFRNKIFGLFNSRCFACNSPKHLQLDHHIALIHGGHREPGNIVILCSRCNQKKWDYLPDEFYSINELEYLAPLLEQEPELLEFEFNYESWNTDPYAYLKGIGISPLLINEIKSNPNHDWNI